MGAYFLYNDPTGATNTLKFDIITDESWSGKNTVTEHPVETGADVADNVRVGLSECQLTIWCTNEPFQANSFSTVTPQTVTLSVDAPDQDTVNPALTLTAQLWDNGLSLRTVLQGVGAAVGSLAGGAVGGLVGNVAGGVLGGLLDPPHEVDTPFSPGIGLDPTSGQAFGAKLQTVDTPDDFVARMYSALETLRQSVQLITVVGSKNYKENMVIESVDMDRSADTGTGAEFTVVLKELRFVTTQTVNAPKPTIARAKAPVSKGPQNPVASTPKKRASVLAKLEKLTSTTIASVLEPGDFKVPEF